MEVPKKPPDSFFKSIKVPLKYVLKNPEINELKINNAAIMCNKIVIQVLMFMKLYLLDHFETHKSLPVIDKLFVNSCMKILCIEKPGRPPNKETKELKDKLTSFYKTHFQPLLQKESLEYTHLNIVLDYLSIDILTMYENNIKQHFIEYIERYVNVIWKKKFIVEKICKMNITKKEKDIRVSNLCSQLRKIKNDILSCDKDFSSKSFYHDWIKIKKQTILPNRVFKKNSVYYDLQCSPFEYLPCMINMMKIVEAEDLTISNVFPLRSEITPKHITLDTTILVHLLFTKTQGNKCDYVAGGNLKRNEDKIWRFFFRTERDCFRNSNYSFHHMIESDGVSCSVLLLRKDLVGKKLPMMKKGVSSEQYIEDITDYSEIKDKKIVAIDPGKCDLIFCVDSDNKEANTFHYSQDQRRKETKSKKYSKIQLFMKKDEKIDGKTIMDYETELSVHNKKTLSITKFKEYIKKKSEINGKLFIFYQQYIFRKLKLNSYINTKKSEQRMLNNFKKIFGPEKDTIVCFGDFEQKKHMKFKEPTVGKGIRTLFRKAGYKTYLVDEFRTSCRCSKCHIGICEKSMVRTNPRPYRKGNVLVHGLIRCKNGCGFWNRDVNGATNIYRITKAAINRLGRPSYLSRNKSSGGLDEPS